MSCSAFGCTTRHSKESAVQFFRFPSNNARLKQWLVKMRRDTSKWNPKKSRLCSSHFEEDQFFTDKQGKRRLKDTAVPTIFNFPPHLGPKEGRNRATRTMFVNKINCMEKPGCTQPVETCTGGPMGLILGPTLFSVYINDVTLAAGNSQIHLYANDTILYTSGLTLDTVETKPSMSELKLPESPDPDGIFRDQDTQTLRVVKQEECEPLETGPTALTTCLSSVRLKMEDVETGSQNSSGFIVKVEEEEKALGSPVHSRDTPSPGSDITSHSSDYDHSPGSLHQPVHSCSSGGQPYNFSWSEEDDDDFDGAEVYWTV